MSYQTLNSKLLFWIRKNKIITSLNCAFFLIISLILIFKMETNNFYLHLPSNTLPTSPQEVSNTISNYVTRLNRKINLSQNWEVALTDISYTKSWYNIMKDQRIILIDNALDEIDLDESLLAGNYETVEEIINSINRILFDFVEKNYQHKITYAPCLIYNKQSNKVKIRLGAISKFGEKRYLYPKFANFLAQLLGLTDSQNRQYPHVENSTPFSVVEAKPKVKNYIPNIYLQSPVISNIPINTTTENVSNKKSTDIPISQSNNTLNKPNSENNSNESNKSPQNSTAQKLLNSEALAGATSWMYGDDSNVVNRTTDGVSNYQTNYYVEGFKEVTLQGSIHSLYVYCSVIKPVLVGNFEVPLIRRVEIPNNKKFGDTIEINYPQPQYYPLVTYEFDNIEIDIKDDTNNSLDFAFGRTAVTLHFRQKQNNAFKSLYSLLR